MIQERIKLIVSQLNIHETEKLKSEGRMFFFENDNKTLRESNRVSFSEKKKYYHINFGSSGAFLVDKSDGEIFNIKGYGVPDKNKKLKADLGNINSVSAKTLYLKRYNPLR